MKNARGAKFVAGIIVAIPFIAIALYVIITSVGGGSKEYSLDEDGGNRDYSQVSVTEAYDVGEYEKILDDVRDSNWPDEGGYYVRIVCEADETVLAEARGAVGTKASAQTGVDDGEWLIETTSETC